MPDTDCAFDEAAFGAEAVLTGLWALECFFLAILGIRGSKEDNLTFGVENTKALEQEKKAKA